MFENELIYWLNYNQTTFNLGTQNVCPLLAGTVVVVQGLLLSYKSRNIKVGSLYTSGRYSEMVDRDQV